MHLHDAPVCAQYTYTYMVHLNLHGTSVYTQHTCAYTVHMYIHNTPVLHGAPVPTRYTCDYMVHLYIHNTHVHTQHTCAYTVHLYLHNTPAPTQYTMLRILFLRCTALQLPRSSEFGSVFTGVRRKRLTTSDRAGCCTTWARVTSCPSRTLAGLVCPV